LYWFDDPALGVEDALGQVIGIVCLAEHVLDRAFLFAPELEERVVHELHAELGSGLNGRADAERLVLANQIGDA
jgi:hypothetical protein